MNPANEDRAVYAILLVVESFNKERFFKEPWGLICNVIVNEPLGAEMIYLLDILQPSKPVSINIGIDVIFSSAVALARFGSIGIRLLQPASSYR